jgi:UPF0755 protein
VSDDFGKGGIPPGGDPLFDPNDPEAVEREERRREREAKRAQKRGKKVQKDPPPLSAPKPPPPAPRTPEQEFWDEPAEPTTPPPAAPPSGKAPPAGEAPPEKGKRGRGFLRRRKGKAAAAGAAGAAAAGSAAASGATPPATGEQPTAPTGESPVPPAQPPATGEQPTAAPATGGTPAPPQTGDTPSSPAAGQAPESDKASASGRGPAAPGQPATGEQPVAPQAGPPTAEQPLPGQPGPATTEQPLPGQSDRPAADGTPPGAVGPATTKQPLPGQVGQPTAEQPLPGQGGPPTAEGPLPVQVGQPTAEQALPGQGGPPTAEQSAAGEPTPPTAEAPRSGEPVTGEEPTAQAAVPPGTEAPHRAAAEAPRADPGQGVAEGPRRDPVQPGAGEPTTGEEPTVAAAIPPQTEATHARAAAGPQVDPGRGTADSPRQDPNQPTGEHVVPGQGPSTGERRALPPRPLEETGAGDWEPPPPRDDDDWFGDDEPFDDEGDPRMAGAARTGRRHTDEHRRRFGGPLGPFLRHPFRILGVVIVIVILLFLNALFQPFHGDGSGKVAVVIPKGASVGEVGNLLEKKGVISNGFLISGSTFFQARVTISGDRSNLIAGKHLMQKDMSYGDAIDQLTKESKPVEAKAKPGVIEVTIPEGQSRPITAKLIKEDGINGSYMRATKKSKLLNPEKYGGKNVKNLEGFLFPDTWQFNTRKPVKNLVALQLQDFKKKIKKVNMKYAKSKNLTVYDVVTIASIIEREAAVAKQRKLVASVIYNRLSEGMTLGMDSTIRFATGNYSKPLTQSELESESPYNTRTNVGLPPGPINSPGLAALNAAAHPAKTEFLFFVNNPNSCNELAFAKTEEEFLANEAKYQKAREKNGGNEPSTCK